MYECLCACVDVCVCLCVCEHRAGYLEFVVLIIILNLVILFKVTPIKL